VDSLTHSRIHPNLTWLLLRLLVILQSCSRGLLLAGLLAGQGFPVGGRIWQGAEVRKPDGVVQAVVGLPEAPDMRMRVRDRCRCDVGCGRAVTGPSGNS
jgi:hypothetical protein